MKAKTEGFADLDRTLGDLGKATGRNVLRRAGIAALEPVAEEAARRAPNLFGDLSESVTASTKRPRRHRKMAEVEIYAGPSNLPQAHLQEFGTRHHAPQPFMRPAWDAGKDRVLDDLKQSLGDEIMKATERQARKAARLAAKGG
ncbi:MAG: HK97-gp10 family putative phage morphogenesis protein [Brevundimonas sp.]|uniref:HK97-gp10 family putative phage morphogenesis protein n=1 Tax=Brevundimonas sp. TaxID=1871086 RepID=UPI004034E0F4